MANDYTTLGICKVQFDPVCTDGQPDASRDTIVSCNITNIDENTQISDGISISEASGVPGVPCFELDIPGTPQAPEIVFDTCVVLDPEFDAIASGGTRQVFKNADGTLIGTASACSVEDNCVCACEDAVTACNRWNVTVWNMAYCPGSNNGSYTQGRYIIKRFTNLEFEPNTQTISTNGTSASGNRQYLATAYAPSGAGWAGPADITPIELPFNECVLTFPSDVCPPGDCGCGSCDAEAITPLARAARAGATQATPTTGALPDASELAAA